MIIPPSARPAQASNQDTPACQVVEVPLGQVRIDGNTQARVDLNLAIVDDYAADFAAGKEYDPGEAVYDGSGYWLWDGFHRFHAKRKAGKATMPLRVRPGTVEDARWLATGANKKPLLHRTNADKRLAVRMALLHPYGAGKSDHAIAEHVGVVHTTVGRIRRELESTGAMHQSDQRTGADGRTINTANIGGRRPEPPQACPTCGERCDVPVWHCPGCDRHNTSDLEACPDCEAGRPDNEPPTHRAGDAGLEPATDEPADKPSGYDTPRDGRRHVTAQEMLDREEDCGDRATTDQLGIPLRGRDAVEAFSLLERFEGALALCRRLADMIDDLAGAKGGEAYAASITLTNKAGRRRWHCPDLANCRRELESRRPYSSICPYCLGKNPSCGGCRGLPYVTQSVYERGCEAFPEHQAKIEAMIQQAEAA